MKRIFLSIATVLFVTYIGDCLFFYLRKKSGHDAFGTVQVSRYYAIAEKNNQVEFIPTDPENVDCVHALYPHEGNNPCWYVRRRKEQRIDE